jgi:exodeoxyribonuclease-3
VTTPGIADTCIAAHVERADSHAERWSDHAPVTAEFDLGDN